MRSVAATASAYSAARDAGLSAGESSASRASAARWVMRCSTCASAPLDSITARSCGHGRIRHVAVAPKRERSIVRVRRRCTGHGQRDQQRPLALAQVVAGRLAGHRRVAEHPEQVVAQLERLAERQPVRRSARRAPSGGAPASGGAELQRALDGVLAGLELDHPQRVVGGERRRGPAPARPGTARPSPARASRRTPAARRHAAAGRAATRRTARPPRTAAGRRAGSPPAAPKRSGVARASPARGAARANAACAAGSPRRVAEASITSSCTSAQACSSSRLAAAVTSGVVVVARRPPRASPSRRTRAAAACRRRARTAGPRRRAAPSSADRPRPVEASSAVTRNSGERAGVGRALDHSRSRRGPRAATARTLRWTAWHGRCGTRFADRAADVLLRVLAAEDRRGRAAAVEDDPRAGAAAAVVRVGDLRRRRLDPRPHDRDHRADRARTPRCCRSRT